MKENILGDSFIAIISCSMGTVRRHARVSDELVQPVFATS